MPKKGKKASFGTEVSQNDSVASVELSAEQLAKIKSDYESAQVRNESLLDEVVFILSGRLKASEIKVHGIEERIKTLNSVLGKCKRDGITEFGELKDVVGARVICLFRSDLERVGRLIGENFEIVEVDDKLSGENSPLGYLSIHYRCKMPAHYTGPRYENTSNLLFEIQVRTLCMHAWAAVSHYLDYKGDWDVPADLKRALNALSGLFYVADNEFEQFYAARVESLEKAEKNPDAAGAKDVNLDTMTAYLAEKFPDRVQTPSSSVSKLIQQLKSAGYTSISQIDADFDRASDGFLRYEVANPPAGGGKFFAEGAIRLGLQLISKDLYRALRSKSYEKRNQEDPLLKFRELVSGVE